MFGMTHRADLRSRHLLGALAAAGVLVLAACPRPAGERYDPPADLGAPDVPDHPPQDEIVIHHFDVGQADATLVRGPDGTILIDAGHWQQDDVVPYVRGAGVDEIDVVILTHPHADHLGQLPDVLDSFEVGEVWHSGYEHESATFERALDATLESDAGYREPRAGDREVFGELVVEVLNPAGPPEDVHDNLAVRIEYRDFRAIYTGDAEVEHEAAMVARHDDLGADLYQLGHHGSRTSSTAEFLEAMEPDVAIYSAAEDSQYDHPHDEVVERIEGMAIDLYGTPKSGTIVVSTDGDDYRIEEDRDPALAAAGDGGCIDINTAPAGQLEEITHTGPAMAERIIEARPFGSLSDLHDVHGFGDARVSDIVEEGLACVE